MVTKRIDKISEKLDNIANDIHNASDSTYTLSILQLEEIITEVEAKPQCEEYARALLLQGRIFARLGRNENGLRSLSVGLQISEPYPDIHSQFFDALARLFSDTNRTTMAELYFKKSLDLKLKIGDFLGEAISLQGLALHFYKQGELDKSVDYYQKSLARHQHINNLPGIVNITSRLASAMLDTREYSKVEKLLNDAKGFTTPSSPSYAHNLGVEAALQWQHYANQDTAIRLFKQAIARFQKSKDNYGIGLIHLRWGQCYRLDNDQKEAIRHFKKAIDRFDKSGDRRWLVEAILALDTVSERTPRKIRIKRLKAALSTAYAEGSISGQQDLEDRLRFLSEEEYLQLLVESSSPGVDMLSTQYIAGSREVASILFADVAEFCAYSEHREPHQVFGILNGMYDAIQKAFDETGGIVAGHMGDGIMVIFLDQTAENHADRAVEAGKRVQKYLTLFNAMIEMGGHPPIQLRVGINSGEMFIGRVGTKNRWTVSTIGSSTNLASRLEGAAKPGTVLISEMTYRRLQNGTGLKPAAKIRMKGFSEPVKTYVWTQNEN